MGRTERKRNRKNHITQDEDYDLIELKKWLKLKNTKLKVCNFADTGRGIKCMDKISIGDELIAIPFEFLITVETDCDIFSILNVQNCSPQLIIATLLIYESHLGELSKYINYLKVLPKSYTTLYFCNEEEIKLLPTFMSETLTQQIAGIKYQFEILQEKVKNQACPHCNGALEDFFSFEKFVWAWFTVNTRAVHYKNKEKSSMALAPFLDMFNHSNTADVEVNIDNTNSLYILKSLTSYKKYDQVFIKYGSHSNLKLLLEYGFILPNNINDIVWFPYSEVMEVVKKYDPNYGEISKIKYSFIVKNHLFRNLSKDKEEFSWSFNALLYILITQDQDCSVLHAKAYSNNFSEQESKIIKDISQEIIKNQSNQLYDNLRRMESIQDCSSVFSIAKTLVQIYIRLLEAILRVVTGPNGFYGTLYVSYHIFQHPISPGEKKSSLIEMIQALEKALKTLQYF